MKPEQLKIRASAIGDIMTNPRSKSEMLGATAINAVNRAVIAYKYGRWEDHQSKYTEKGHKREEDALTMLSLHLKTLLFKNETNLENDYITGTPDAWDGGKLITEAQTIYDVKNSWSLFTYMDAKTKPLDKSYYWQGMAYMWMTGAKKHVVAYCLNNNTSDAIEKEKYWLAQRLNSDTSPAYLKKAEMIERNGIFDLQSFMDENPHFDFVSNTDTWEYDIPAKDRIHLIKIERNEDEINQIIERVKLCREWLKQLA